MKAAGADTFYGELFFDRETGLLRTTIIKCCTPFPNVGVLEEYRRVQGGMVPMSIKSLRDGRTLTQATILEVEFRDSYDPEIFAKK